MPPDDVWFIFELLGRSGYTYCVETAWGYGFIMVRFLAGLLLAAVLTAGAAAAGEGGYRFIEIDGYRVKWGAPEMGRGAEVTYAYVNRPMSDPDAINCRSMVSMDGLLALSGVERETLEKEVAAAFALWQAVADITFTRAADPPEADILIGTQAEPRRFGFTNVTPEALTRADSETGIRPLARARICLNPTRLWKVGFDADLDVYDLRYTIAHEIGHAIGLDHPGPAGQLMGFTYKERFRDLQPGDLAGARLLYGPRVPSPLAENDVMAAPRAAK